MQTYGRKRLVILDPSLRRFDGHFYHYDQVISQEANAYGVETTVWASRCVTREAGVGMVAVPCFRFQLEDSSETPAALATAFYEDLQKAAQQIPCTQDVIFFLHTTTSTQIPPAVRFIGSERNRYNSLVILLRYSPLINPTNPDTKNVEQYRKALQMLSDSAASDRIRLISDSDLLINEYSNITDKPIELVPIPHVEFKKTVTGDTETQRIVYLGNARSSKGFQYLPYVISQIRPYLAAREWAAEIQANVMFERDKESVLAVCQLRKEPVTLWEHELTSQQYASLLGRASLVVIPYQTLWYHSQTSGVFAEAVGQGKPVVVPKGTWMARQLTKNGAGFSFFPGDRVDLANAVLAAMKQVDFLQAKAEQSKSAWVCTHNPKEFVNHLLKGNHCS